MPYDGQTLAFGGDYNPEQWPEEAREEDVRLMRAAGVTLVSFGVFAWARMEPRRGAYDFARLDRIIGMLHDAGIGVALATPTVVPPAWLYRAHPEALPVTREGVRPTFGARGAICHSNPHYRAASREIASRLGERYGRHPAVVLWHVHDEYGAPVTSCFCDTCAVAFRHWLMDRNGTLGALNQAWGTAFWGQQYGAWEEIEAPRATPTVTNPTQQLDFRLTGDGLAAVVDLALTDAGITPAALPRDVELVLREGESGTYRFAANHTGGEVKVVLPDGGRAAVPAGAVEVFREPR